MPANNRSTKSTRKTKKKIAKKATKKVAKKVAKKAAKKVAKKPAKNPAKKVAKKAARKTARRPQGSRPKVGAASVQQRHEMIEKAAYYRAEKRNFENGDPVTDWLSCEKEVDALLSRAAR